jgi:hypothetical protein
MARKRRRAVHPRNPGLRDGGLSDGRERRRAVRGTVRGLRVNLVSLCALTRPLAIGFAYCLDVLHAAACRCVFMRFCPACLAQFVLTDSKLQAFLLLCCGVSLLVVARSTWFCTRTPSTAVQGKSCRLCGGACTPARCARFSGSSFDALLRCSLARAELWTECRAVAVQSATDAAFSCCVTAARLIRRVLPRHSPDFSCVGRCLSWQLLSEPALMEPVYRVDVTLPKAALDATYNTIHSRRGCLRPQHTPLSHFPCLRCPGSCLLLFCASVRHLLHCL